VERFARRAGSTAVPALALGAAGATAEVAR
jgi:hypothetical protein